MAVIRPSRNHVYIQDLIDHLTFGIETSGGLMEHIDNITNLFFSLDTRD